MWVSKYCFPIKRSKLLGEWWIPVQSQGMHKPSWKIFLYKKSRKLSKTTEFCLKDTETSLKWFPLAKDRKTWASKRIITTKMKHIHYVKIHEFGLPWWRSGWESACQCRAHGFEPWSGKIPHAAEQLGPWATTTEPARLEPLLRNRRGLRTAMKSGPHSPQLEKALAQKRRPNTAKN